jgi:hypothetical protein
MASELVSTAKEGAKPTKLSAASKIMIMDPRQMARDATPVFVGADINPISTKAATEGTPQATLFANEVPSTQEVWDKMKESYGLFPEMNIYGKYQPAESYKPSDNAMNNYATIEAMMADLNKMIYGSK